MKITRNLIKEQYMESCEHEECLHNLLYHELYSESILTQMYENYEDYFIKVGQKYIIIDSFIADNDDIILCEQCYKEMFNKLKAEIDLKVFE